MARYICPDKVAQESIMQRLQGLPLPGLPQMARQLAQSKERSAFVAALREAVPMYSLYNRLAITSLLNRLH